MIIVRLLINPIFNSLFVIKGKMFVICHSLAPNGPRLYCERDFGSVSLSAVKMFKVIKICQNTISPRLKYEPLLTPVLLNFFQGFNRFNKFFFKFTGYFFCHVQIYLYTFIVLSYHVNHIKNVVKLFFTITTFIQNQIVYSDFIFIIFMSINFVNFHTMLNKWFLFPNLI